MATISTGSPAISQRPGLGDRRGADHARRAGWFGGKRSLNSEIYDAAEDEHGDGPVEAQPLTLHITAVEVTGLYSNRQMAQLAHRLLDWALLDAD